MTLVYEVRTKHTKEVLNAFVKFSTKVNHASTTLRLCLFGFCFLLIAFALKGTTGMYISGTVGLLIIIFAFTRKYIGMAKLAASDPNYSKGNEITYQFGQSEFVIKNMEGESDIHVKYGEITEFYWDKRFYYVNINNQDLNILPKKDFVVGESVKFQEFFAQKIKVQVIKLNPTPKERITKMRVNMRAADERHDLEAARRRRESKEEKDRKRGK